MALGVILTPYGHTPGYPPSGITRNARGATSWAGPFDPQFYTRGQAGFFYDTPLGGVPTDFDLARRRGFLPVVSGWVQTQQGYQTGGWLPPGGYYPGQPAAARVPLTPLGLNGLRDALPPATETSPPATAEDVLAVLAAHNDRIFAITVVSTMAVAVSALIGLFRTLKLIKDDKRG